ncbi:MAG: carboxypeptidase-like regulatory domain-containing protein [Blastocatellia bacterium]
MKLQSKYAIQTAAVLVSLLAAASAPARQQAQETGGAIKGKVKEQGGKPLEGVTVRAANAKEKESKEAGRETRTDGKGDFEFAGLEPGEYSLSFEKTGYKTFTTRKLEVVSGETLKLSRTVELPREGEPYSAIRGAVLYGVGYTMPNATITIERIDSGKKFRQETISREGGEFAFRLKSEKAQYRITASARGFQPASTEIEIEGGEVRNIALTLQPAK